jgi:hypothetical protein
VVSKYLPRKGTETGTPFGPTGIQVSKYLPRKGTETGGRSGINPDIFRVSKYLPRKGTETGEKGGRMKIEEGRKGEEIKNINGSKQNKR